jgi:hypothetical protein
MLWHRRQFRGRVMVTAVELNLLVESRASPSSGRARRPSLHCVNLRERNEYLVFVLS